MNGKERIQELLLDMETLVKVEEKLIEKKYFVNGRIPHPMGDKLAYEKWLRASCHLGGLKSALETIKIYK